MHVLKRLHTLIPFVIHSKILFFLLVFSTIGNDMVFAMRRSSATSELDSTGIARHRSQSVAAAGPADLPSPHYLLRTAPLEAPVDPLVLRQLVTALHGNNSRVVQNILERIPEVTNLDFGDYLLEPAAFGQLFRALECKPVTSVSLRCLGGGADLSALLWAKEINKTNIVSLNLSSSGLTDRFLSRFLVSLLSTSGKRCPLRKLDVSHNALRGAYPDTFNRLNELELDELNLSGNDLGAAGLQNLKRCFPRSLTSLKLANTGIDDVGMGELCEVLKGSAVTDLDIPGNCIEKAGLQILATVLPETLIQVLNLSLNNIDNESLSVLKGEGNPLRNIIALRLEGNPLGSSGVANFREFVLTGLQALDLSGTYMGAIDPLEMEHFDGGIGPLFLALENTQVKELALSGNNLGDARLSCLSALAKGLKRGTIHTLILSDNNILPDALSFFNPAFSDNIELDEEGREIIDGNQNPFHSLRHLSLARNPLGIEGARMIALFSIPHLRVLDLSGTSMDKSCLKTLHRILSASEIEELDLSHNKIESNLFNLVGYLVGMPALKKVDLSHNHIGDGTTRDFTIPLKRGDLPLVIDLKDNLVSLDIADKLMVTFPHISIRGTLSPEVHFEMVD
ncbi:MAG: hypothetical protein JSR85_08460 [Proteobacteria bacterium]|nr:hypothetical protein [Pseudomonadota bacterium]